MIEVDATLEISKTLITALNIDRLDIETNVDRRDEMQEMDGQ